MKKIMFIGLMLGAAAAGVYGNESGIFSFNAGQFEVFMLVESERDGSAGILVGADETILRRYIPVQGFKHTANAFLIKAPGQNILIDTGTGAGGVITEKIRSLGVRPEDINVILLTHLHADHFGGLIRDGAAVYPNAKVYLSENELRHFTVTNVNTGAVNALAPYRSRLETFRPGALADINMLAEVVPGIYPIAAYGHTPGHTIYLLQSGRARLLIVGDLFHVALVQFHVPSISATFDIDGPAAARTRQQVFSYAAANRIPIGGMHLVYPGIGMLEAYNNGNSFLFSSME
ncbi:MAG: MBL fold metallo-hydrolase [Treponema sp.]|nr:MBL fold metallo-hydrolase [Treponema sp.]